METSPSTDYIPAPTSTARGFDDYANINPWATAVLPPPPQDLRDHLTSQREQIYSAATVTAQHQFLVAPAPVLAPQPSRLFGPDGCPAQRRVGLEPVDVESVLTPAQDEYWVEYHKTNLVLRGTRSTSRVSVQRRELESPVYHEEEERQTYPIESSSQIQRRLVWHRYLLCLVALSTCTLFSGLRTRRAKKA
jgi:hypothetical protein